MMRSLLVLLCGALLINQAAAEESKEPKSATVGAPMTLSDVVLPGSELVAKPLAGDPAMIVQITDSIRHGDSWRYTFRFSGLEPGPYDLSEWLIRKDGSPVGELPEVPVQIESLLPAGQVTPNELPTGWLPSLGGYKVVMTVAVVLWSLVLLALLLGGRRKKQHVEVASVPKRSLADMLQERLEAGFKNKVPPEQYAELERMLFSWWRKRLDLESVPADKALARIRNDDQAGPLMVQLEQWMHRPNGTAQDVDLSKLLEPYRDLPVTELEGLS